MKKGVDKPFQKVYYNTRKEQTNKYKSQGDRRYTMKKLVNFYMHISLVKLMVGFLIAMTIILSISVNVNATTNHNHKTVKRTEYAVVIDVSVKDNLTYIKTGDGNVWTFKESDSDVGDVYKITFNTMNTKKKTDDRIVAIRYIGYISNVKNA